MSKAKRTPGEWTVLKVTNDLGLPHAEEVWDVVSLQGVDGTTRIAEFGPVSHPESKANAECTVVSVRSHDALVEACVRALGEFHIMRDEHTEWWHDTMTTDRADAWDALKQALALAGK